MHACSRGLTRPSSVLSTEGESTNEVVISYIEQNDDQPILSVVDGQVVAFLIGFVSQTYPDQAYEHFFATAASLGCRTVHGVTAPVNRNSMAFHRRMGFSLLDSDVKIDGVPVAVGDDGEGEDRVIFTKNLDILDIVW